VTSAGAAHRARRAHGIRPERVSGAVHSSALCEASGGPDGVLKRLRDRDRSIPNAGTIVSAWAITNRGTAFARGSARLRREARGARGGIEDAREDVHRYRALLGRGHRSRGAGCRGEPLDDCRLASGGVAAGLAGCLLCDGAGARAEATRWIARNHERVVSCTFEASMP